MALGPRTSRLPDTTRGVAPASTVPPAHFSSAPPAWMVTLPLTMTLLWDHAGAAAHRSASPPTNRCAAANVTTPNGTTCRPLPFRDIVALVLFWNEVVRVEVHG